MFLFPFRSSRAPHPAAWNFVTKYQNFGLSYGDNSRSLSHVVLKRYQNVTDRHQDTKTKWP